MEPEYFYQRAEARLGNRQAALASADLDQAITLKPDYVPALVARAELRLNRCATRPATRAATFSPTWTR